MKKKILVLSLILVMFSGWQTRVLATEDQGEPAQNMGGGADFGVSAVYPENQIGGQSGYFNLRVLPEQEQIIQVIVKNYSEKKITILIERNRGTTGDAGIPEYKNINKKKDDSLVVDFEEIVTLEQEKVTLEAQTEQSVSIKVKIPKESFKGQILGGIHFIQEQESNNKQDKMIINQFSYSIAVLLTEADEVVPNELVLVEVVPGQRNYRNFIEATIQNGAPIMIKNLSLTEKIENVKTKQVLYEGNQEELRMAPNSSFSNGADLEKENLLAGHYLYTLDALADGQTYHLTKEFEIKAEDAKKLNSQSVYSTQAKGLPIWLIIGSGVIVLTLLVVGGILLVTKNRSKSNK